MQIPMGSAVSGNSPVGERAKATQSQNQRKAQYARATPTRKMHVWRGVCAGGRCLKLGHEGQAEVMSIRETMGYDSSLHKAAPYRRLRHCKRRRRHSYQRAAQLVSGGCG